MKLLLSLIPLFVFTINYDGIWAGKPLKECPIPTVVIEQALKSLKKSGTPNLAQKQAQNDGTEDADKAETFKHLDANNKEWKFMERKVLAEGGEEYLFKEYAPNLFAHLRTKVFGMKTDEYLHFLTAGGLKKYENPGNGGSHFFLTSDEHFMLKSVHLDGAHLSQFEDKALHSHLGAYAKHMEQNRNSLLSKYYGLYSIEEFNNPANVLWFFAMPNILKPPNVRAMPTIHYRFDIKGYHFSNRKAPEREFVRTDGTPTLRDVDFNGGWNKEARIPNGIILPKESYTQLMDILDTDGKFLSTTFNAFDYSLFFGIHFNTEEEEQEAEKFSNQRHHQHHGASSSDNPDPDHHHQQMPFLLPNGGILGHCVDCIMPKNDVPNKDVGNGNVKGNRHRVTIFPAIIDLLTANLVDNRYKQFVWIYQYIPQLGKMADSIVHNVYTGNFMNFVKKQVFKAE